MEITRPRTCNGNYTPRDLYCTPWESCGEGAYRNLLFYCRGVLTVLKSIHPRHGKKNVIYGSIMPKIVLVTHLTYENQWDKLRTKIQTFAFLGHPITRDSLP